jgi:hypothetical protein
MRALLMHCRDVKVSDGRKIACLIERGPALAPLCKTALKIGDPVRRRPSHKRAIYVIYTCIRKHL